MEQGISKLSLDKGDKFKEVMEAYQGRGLVCVDGKKKEERRRKCEDFFWFLCVQESSMERMCARIKQEKNLCSKYLLQAFGLLF